MKFSGYVRLAVIAALVLNQTQSFAEDVKKAPSNVKDPLAEASSSREAMLESMNDPVANKAFHDIQLQVLQTQADALVYNYFTKNQIFAPLYNFLIQNNDALLSGFEMQAKSTMVQTVRGITPEYDLIDKLVVEVASSLGFTKEAIANRQIYVLGGDENAFTVSGSQTKIIVAFQRGILRKWREGSSKTRGMIRTEIAAILAHELGHIRAEHTVKGIMNQIMLQVVGELFVNGKLSVSPMDTAARISRIEAITHEACVGVCTHSKSILEKQSVGSVMKNNKQSFIDQQIQEFVMNFASLPRPQLQAAVASYIQLLIRIGKIEVAPPQTIRYFESLLRSVPDIGASKREIQEFMTHAKMMEYAISRAKETTADQISAATVRNEHLASSFAKLIGLDFDKEFRPQVFEQIKKQAQEILTTIPPEMLYGYVGSTHPSLILRINKMLSVPAYPSVLFANNYLRLLLLNDSLISMEANAKAYLESFKANVNETKRQALEQMIAAQGGQATEAQIKETSDSIDKEVVELTKKLEANLARIQKSQVDQEARVMKLLFSDTFRADTERSPRMDNTIQYLSVQREVLFITADRIETQIEQLMPYLKSSNPMEVQQAEHNMASLVSGKNAVLRNLDLQKLTIDRIRAKIVEQAKDVTDYKKQNNLKKRYLLLTRILQATSSEDLEKARSRVTGVNPNLRDNTEYLRNKIPQKISDKVVYAPGAGLVCSKLFIK